MMTPQELFEQLNPPPEPNKSADFDAAIFGLIVCGLILWGIVSIIKWNI